MIGERVPFDPEAVREIMSQGMTDEEYRNAQDSIEDVFDEQEDRACGCCGPLLKASLVNNGVQEQIKWHDAWQVMHNLHKLQDCGESKYEPSVVFTRGHKKGPIMFVSVSPSLVFALLYRKRNKHILSPRMRRALNKGKIIFMVSI